MEQTPVAEATATPRLRALLAAGAVLAAAGVLSPPSAAASLMAAGVAASGIVFAGRQLFNARLAALERLRVRREVRGPLVEGREAEARIVLENPSTVPLEHLEVLDQPPPFFQWRRRPRWVVTVPARGRVVVRYRFRPVVGSHSWGPLRLVAADPLGLYRARRIVADPLVARVQPRLMALPRVALSMPTLLQPGGVSKSRRRGVGTEFVELREYRPGDEVRTIDWKASARLGRLIVKVFEQETSLNVAVVLDASAEMFRGPLGNTVVEWSARLVATMAEYLARRGDRYRLYLLPPGGASPRSTPWLWGRASSGYARRWLAENLAWPTVGEDRAAEEWLSAGGRAAVIARALVRGLPRGKTLVFIVTTLEGGTAARRYAEKLRPLVALYNSVYVVMPLPTAFEAEALDSREALLYRILLYRRIQLEAEAVKALRRGGLRAYAALPGDLLGIILSRIEAERGATA